MSNIRTFNSYKDLFKINFKVHDFFGKSLPRPIPLENIIMTVVIMIPLYPITNIFGARHPFMTTIILSAICSWMLSQFDLRGKYMPIFFKDILAYIFRHKTTNLMGKKIKLLKRYRADWRLPEVIE
ncbi:hypothetical protein Dtox_2509 [Desulfofarcimen acetoxidans DSM 771]|uniref:TcpE family protein n=1 Tax=Desulfofarcimen acetoxidans (strain ATCC 49208 / DSM 771 / KCTC 5769 / VKM B-1644 / 5575) TaxID=485916 RepID=C8W0Q9_DESAS|nr:conjugal transfer protein [Desulfofarcimen acetoxidans]ACV63314.1 hypothetical protein Dtox_2509 [Desulfofarcimen acetoxidans DSM 771]